MSQYFASILNFRLAPFVVGKSRNAANVFYLLNWISTMPNWMTVDDETALALYSRLPDQNIVRLDVNSALELALRQRDTTVAVLPCRGLGETALAVLRWNRFQPVPDAQPKTNVRAGGFLGLTDESVFADDPEPKKRWWRRWWDGE
jgi:hypothetical protein